MDFGLIWEEVDNQAKIYILVPTDIKRNFGISSTNEFKTNYLAYQLQENYKIPYKLEAK